jgi:hypothetical protein
MKNWKCFTFLAIFAFVFAFISCDNGSGETPPPTFDGTIDTLDVWLDSQSPNTPATPFTVELNIDDEGDFATLFTTLNNATDKYVYLDLTGSTVTTIPENAFYTQTPPYKGCATLTGITIPNGVTTIGNYAFAGCTSLPSVTIPEGVTTIGEGAFYGCTSLASITVAANNPHFMSEGGTLYNKDKTTLIGYPTATGSFTIPASVTTIGEGAFGGCTGLTSVTIPEGATTIGGSAFGGCTSLASVTIPASVTTIGEGGAFYGCTSLTSVTFNGTIASSRFNGNYTFSGDLRDKFYATDATNGTPGTYTRSGSGTTESPYIWTKQ